jgi:cytidine deaminase
MNRSGAAHAGNELLAAARGARARAYAPYSKFKVGAAVRGRSGRVYVGCNVENASFGATICAERAAVASAVSGGERGIAEIAVVAGGGSVAPPCGLCLQTLAEFGGADLRIFLQTSNGRRSKTTALGKLMPVVFDRRYL